MPYVHVHVSILSVTCDTSYNVPWPIRVRGCWVSSEPLTSDNGGSRGDIWQWEADNKRTRNLLHLHRQKVLSGRNIGKWQPFLPWEIPPLKFEDYDFISCYAVSSYIEAIYGCFVMMKLLVITAALHFRYQWSQSWVRQWFPRPPLASKPAM